MRALPGLLFVALAGAGRPAGAAVPADPVRGGAARAAPADSAYVRAEPGDTSWTLGNGLVERRVVFGAAPGGAAPGGGAGTRALRTVAWRHLTTGTDLAALARPRVRARPEFELLADGRPLGEPGALRLTAAESAALPGGGRELRVRMRAADRPLDVTVRYAVYPGHAAVRQWVAVTNRGAAPAVLTRLVVAAVNAAPGPPARLTLDAFYGSAPRETFYTGRVDDPALVVRDARTGEGLVAMNEAPGHLKRTESWGFASWGGGVLVGYDADLFPFERRVAPGETWESAAAGVLAFTDRVPGAGVRARMAAYTAQVLNPRRRAAGPLVVYNTWEPFNQRITFDEVRALVPRAARLGADVFAVDEGWELRLGDNAPDPRRFPFGLDTVRALAEAHGMRLGLWAPIAAVDTTAPVYRAHPEWAARDAAGRVKLTGIAGGHRVAVMDLASPYRAAALARLDSLVRRYRPRYVKLDLTTVASAYGEDVGCHAADSLGHDHRTWAESLVRTYEGAQAVADGLRRAHPDVVVDVSFEAWGHKHLADYGLLAAADADWVSNVEDTEPGGAGPRDARALLYARALALPAEALLVGNLRADVGPAAERLATALGATPLLLGDLRRAPDSVLAWYGRTFAWYKALRRAVPLDETFEPFGAWRQPRAGAWDGFARRSAAGEGLVAVFRNGAADARVVVALPLTGPAAAATRYRVRSALTGRSLGTFTGAALARGLAVALDRGVDGVEVLEVRRAP